MHPEPLSKDDHKILEKTETMSQPPSSDEEDNRRQSPRLDLKASVSIAVRPQVSVIDVSASGIAFRSSMHFPKNTQIDISPTSAFVVEAVVVKCEMQEPDPDFMDAYYRVQCRFLDEEMGLQVSLMLNGG